MSGPPVSNAVVEGCSGAFGSVIALLATYPLKTIYTLQALSTGGDSNAPGPSDPGARLLAAVLFLQQYKLSSLYVGLGPNIVESALSSGVYFFFYSKLREQAVAWARERAAAGGPESRSKDIGVLASLLVATTAGAFNQLITMPASVVATRMQGYRSLPGASTRRNPPTTWETISSVFHEDGVAGFWKGMLPSMILLANPAVQYMLFEKIQAVMRFWKSQRVARAAAAAAAAAKPTAAIAAGVDGTQQESAPCSDLLSRKQSADGDDAMEVMRVPNSRLEAATQRDAGGQLSALEVFLAGALAKIGATVATYPLIVVKARLQASAGGQGSQHRASTWGIISDTARREGLGGFFKGLRAKILQTALNAALMLMLKDQLHGVTRSALTLATTAAGPVPTAASATVPRAASKAVQAPSAAG